MKFVSLYEPAVFLTSLANGALLLAVLAAPSDADSQAKPAQQIPQAVVDTHDLMELFNQPLYRYLQKAMQQEPTDDQGWQTIRQRGLQAAEVANLVALRKDSQQWQQLAGKLQQAGIDLAKAAEGQDFGKTQQAYRTLIERCNACHQTMAPQRAPQLEPQIGASN